MATKKKKAAEKTEESSSSHPDSDSSGDAGSDAGEKKASAAADKAEEKPVEEPKKLVLEPLRAEFKPHDSYPPITAAETVEYCPIDGLPPDFCQYGPLWEKAKPWCMEHYPHYYPELSGVSLEDAKKKAAEATAKSKIKELPGGKKKAEAAPEVTVKKLTRGGRKCIVCVSGLESFGVKLDAAAKLFKKKFACGASVVKGENGLPDMVELQGDFEQEVIDLICAEWKEVPRDRCMILDGGTKKKGKSGR